MKKILLPLVCAILLFSSCKKDETTPAPAPTTPTPATPAISGNWKIQLYDNSPIAAPSSGTMVFTSSSATAGTVKFDITFDGSSHSIEDDTYALSSSDTKIDFTKTGGTLMY